MRTLIQESVRAYFAPWRFAVIVGIIFASVKVASGADKPKIDPAVAAAWAFSASPDVVVQPSGVIVQPATEVRAIPFRPAIVAPSVVGVSTASAATARTGGIIILAPRGTRGFTNCAVG